MKNTRKNKLNLNRESIVELHPQMLDGVVGGQAQVARDQSKAIVCISENKHSCIMC
jgi:hypothetical protein